MKMREGAEAKAKELGITFKSYAGKFDGDHESQVQAIEACVADKVPGILIVVSDPAGIVPQVKQARDAGILVIALDTPLSPTGAANATFATDNFQAGVLIGEWATARLGDEAASARIAMLNAPISHPTVDVARDRAS
jgi:fructose transport system substrate-binding protein